MDIVERLRDLAERFPDVDVHHISVKGDWVSPSDECLDAANEIVSLRQHCEAMAKALERINKHAMWLRGERSYREFGKLAQREAGSALTAYRKGASK